MEECLVFVGLLEPDELLCVGEALKVGRRGQLSFEDVPKEKVRDFKPRHCGERAKTIWGDDLGFFDPHCTTNMSDVVEYDQVSVHVV